MNVTDIHTFTYIKDSSGYISYIKEILGDMASVTSVYLPDPHGPIYRAGQTYTKLISHGLGYEWPYLRARASATSYDYLHSKAFTDPKTGEESLTIPLDSIVEMYDDKQTLHDLINGKLQLPHSDGCQKFTSALKTLNQYIELDRLGLYGSLAAQVHKPGSNLCDIDVLVDGIDAYSAVITMSKGNFVDPVLLSDPIRTNPIRRQAALRRGQLSQMRLSEFSDTVCDVRIVRLPSDPNTYAACNKRLEGSADINLEGALVTNASESLCLPFAYTITYQGNEYHVIGNYYGFMAAATVGDKVNVKGLLVDGKYIYISDSTAHYIYDVDSHLM